MASLPQRRLDRFCGYAAVEVPDAAELCLLMNDLHLATGRATNGQHTPLHRLQESSAGKASMPRTAASRAPYSLTARSVPFPFHCRPLGSGCPGPPRLAEVASDLTGGARNAETIVHLDPIWTRKRRAGLKASCRYRRFTVSSSEPE
jgi:hypothetical protein